VQSLNLEMRVSRVNNDPAIVAGDSFQTKEKKKK